MARSISSIRQYLIDTLVSVAAAVGITINPNQWSKYDYKNLILNTVATAQGIEEQLWDELVTEIEAIVSVAAPETDAWFQDQILNKFQFDSATPQVVGIYAPNFQPSYPNPNSSLNIIKYCSVNPGTYGTTLIKCAAQANGLPADVDTTYGAGTLDTVRAFIRAISNPGITKVVTSGQADRLFMQLDVYYNGLYAAVIDLNVKNTIISFLASLQFNGYFVNSDLEVAIKNISGVYDCIIYNMTGRDNGTSYPGGTILVSSTATNNRLYNSQAGYIILEDTTGFTLDDPRTESPLLNNLNLIAQ